MAMKSELQSGKPIARDKTREEEGPDSNEVRQGERKMGVADKKGEGGKTSYTKHIKSGSTDPHLKSVSIVQGLPNKSNLIRQYGLSTITQTKSENSLGHKTCGQASFQRG